MTFSGHAEDRQLIRERLEIYSDAVMRKDLDAYLACWTEDGRRTGSGGECRGKSELRDHWDGIFGAIEQMAFFTQMASLTVCDDRADARSYCLEVMKLRDQPDRQLVGEYVDELMRVDGNWLFAHRHYRVAMTI
ncbi:hypothetical protein AU191_04185 [Mycolicibacterium acapulense]|nr:hypothetical protein AU191_04185 [Mycolicibacterium acapulense]